MIFLERGNYFTVTKFCAVSNLAANQVICILANNFYVIQCLLQRSGKDLSENCVSLTSFSHRRIEVPKQNHRMLGVGRDLCGAS